MDLEELRKYRIDFSGIGVDLNVAAFDTLGTVAGATLLAKYMDWSVPKTILFSFAVGFGAHMLFLPPEKQTPGTKKILAAVN